MKYYIIPSDYPMTKAEAYKEAKARFNVHQVEQRAESAGIVYRGPRGNDVFTDWEDLPSATHNSYGKL